MASEKLNELALKLSKRNMQHEKAMKEIMAEIEALACEDRRGGLAMAASEMEDCYYNAKANHSRLNRIACRMLEWDIPAALSR